MKRLFAITGLITLLILVLSACSGGGGDSNGTTLNVTMTEFKFDPASWTVPAGKTITINMKNSGSVTHSWALMAKPVSGTYSDANKADVLFDSGPVTAGQSKTATFTAPTTPGNYQVICVDPGHFEDGMIGQLTVK